MRETALLARWTPAELRAIATRALAEGDRLELTGRAHSAIATVLENLQV